MRRAAVLGSGRCACDARALDADVSGSLLSDEFLLWWAQGLSLAERGRGPAQLEPERGDGGSRARVRRRSALFGFHHGFHDFDESSRRRGLAASLVPTGKSIVLPWHVHYK